MDTHADVSNVHITRHDDGTYSITGLTYVQADWVALALASQWSEYTKDATELTVNHSWPKWSYEYHYPEARSASSRKWLLEYVESIAAFSDNLRKRIAQVRA